MCIFTIYLLNIITNIIFVFIIQLVLDRCADILTKVELQTRTIVDAVNAVIEGKVCEPRHMMADRFSSLLGDFKADMLEAHKKEIAELRQEVRGLGGSFELTLLVSQETTSTQIRSK